MLNYMKAEFFKTTHRKGFYLLTGVFVGLCLVVHGIYVFALPSQAHGDYINELLLMGIALLPLPVFLIATISSMTTGEEQRHDTLKNAVMGGMNRTAIFFGKYIVSLVISLISACLILVAYAGAPMLLFGTGGLDATLLGELGLRLLGSLPIYMACLALATLLGLNMKSNTGSIFGYLAIFFFSNPILYYLFGKIVPFFRTLADYTLSSQLEGMYMTGGVYHPMTMRYVNEAMLVGIITLGIFLALGALLFQRREIK
ncbi:ABC transporter permease [Eubacteriales bacterium OttesenSCG-928-M02]|nr:ABC transporter permease [Eubacteriales bacterium OttesenSCG-928-M02]